MIRAAGSDREDPHVAGVEDLLLDQPVLLDQLRELAPLGYRALDVELEPAADALCELEHLFDRGLPARRIVGPALPRLGASAALSARTSS